MINFEHIQLFERYLDAPSYAFGGDGKDGIVTDDDKEIYWSIYEELDQACKNVVANLGLEDKFYVKARPYSRTRGARGHRPLDLWCAIRNIGSDAFNEMPQIYIIVSDRGVEIGFAVSIPESDYHDQVVKIQNRGIIPHIHRKLPIDGPVLAKLDQVVASSPDWHVNSKTRLTAGKKGFDAFQKPSELFEEVKSQVLCHGGGAICRIITPQALLNNPIDLEGVLTEALVIFSDVQQSCSPNATDKKLASTRDEISEMTNENFFLPTDLEDGREKKLRAVATRQGQKKFRRDLLGAYEGKCAVTGCEVTDVLQAAHILPYKGKHTNHPQNGILLRSDIHDLFDLFLISIDPTEMVLRVSGTLENTEYGKLDGSNVFMPKKAGYQPSAEALAWHFDQLLN